MELAGPGGGLGGGKGQRGVQEAQGPWHLGVSLKLGAPLKTWALLCSLGSLRIVLNAASEQPTQWIVSS